jgi:ketosteroid isomerase-like protein
MSKITDKITQIEKEMAAAFNLKDITKMLTFIDKDFTGFSSTTHRRIRGIDAFKKTIEYYLDEATNVKYNTYEIEVQELEGLFITTFYWSVELDHNRHTHEIHGRGTHVFKQDSAKFKIVHEHYSRAHYR